MVFSFHEGCESGRQVASWPLSWPLVTVCRVTDSLLTSLCSTSRASHLGLTPGLLSFPPNHLILASVLPASLARTLALVSDWVPPPLLGRLITMDASSILLGDSSQKSLLLTSFQWPSVSPSRLIMAERTKQVRGLRSVSTCIWDHCGERLGPVLNAAWTRGTSWRGDLKSGGFWLH